MPNETTIYEVSYTDGNGCVSTDSLRVIVNSLPDVNAGNDIDYANGGSIYLDGTTTIPHRIRLKASVIDGATTGQDVPIDPYYDFTISQSIYEKDCHQYGCFSKVKLHIYRGSIFTEFQ